MRAAENPPNPFHKHQCVRSGPPARVPLSVIEERAKSILTRNNSPDIPYRWSINPYRGCGHACAYCYARRAHEYLDKGAGVDFERKLVVKLNAAELLDEALRRRTWRREQIAVSGVTDAYQPLETRYQLTRRCLQVCIAHANPVGVVTKSPLVARDVDVLRDLQRFGSTPVMFSIAFADDRRARLIEPGAPAPSQRFTAMRRLHEADIPVGLLLVPVIPGLNDRDIPAILARAVDCGASRAAYAPVRLPGSVADVFLSRLRAALPDAAGRVEARIRDTRGGRLNNPRFGDRMRGDGPYWHSVQRLFETVAARLGLDAGPPGRTSAFPDPCRTRQLELF
jgi:DNA repair photolyase